MKTINYNHETHETASIRPLFYRFAADSALVTRWQREASGWMRRRVINARGTRNFRNVRENEVQK